MRIARALERQWPRSGARRVDRRDGRRRRRCNPTRQRGGPHREETSSISSGATAPSSTPGLKDLTGYAKTWRYDGMGWARFFLKIDDDLLTRDPGLNQTLISSGTSISQFFTQDKWERHRSISRYIRHLQTLFTSMVFVRTLEPIACVTGVALALTVWNVWLPQYTLSISPIPHTLLGTVLGLLLVFRTNSSYARFDEGRRLTGAMVTNLREVVRFSSVWIATKNRDRAHKIAKLAVAFAYCLKSHTRRGRTRDDLDDPTRFEDDPSVPVQRLVDEVDSGKLLSSRHKPLRALMLLSSHLKESFEAEELPWHIHQECEQRLTELGRSLGGCERLLSTPIPLSYTRHTSRTLALWLLFLPLALWSSMGPCVVPAIFVTTYLLLGIDEIGIQIEEPFCTLPLQPQCEAFERVAAEIMAAGEA